MNKIVILVRSASGAATDSERDRACLRIEQCARALAAAEPAVTGLVLSRVVRPFANRDPLVALIAVWGNHLDPQAVLEQVVPGTLRTEAGLTLTAATCTELVFRQVRDFARDGSPWTIKLAGTAFRRDDFEPNAFFDYWTNRHAPIGGNLPGLGGYTVSRVLDGQLGEEAADALLEQWYTDAQTFDAGQSTEMAQAAWNDVGNYAKTTGTAFWLLTETVIVEPPVGGPGTLEV